MKLTIYTAFVLSLSFACQPKPEAKIKELPIAEKTSFLYAQYAKMLEQSYPYIPLHQLNIGQIYRHLGRSFSEPASYFHLTYLLGNKQLYIETAVSYLGRGWGTNECKFISALGENGQKDFFYFNIDYFDYEYYTAYYMPAIQPAYKLSCLYEAPSTNGRCLELRNDSLYKIADITTLPQIQTINELLKHTTYYHQDNLELVDTLIQLLQNPNNFKGMAFLLEEEQADNVLPRGYYPSIPEAQPVLFYQRVYDIDTINIEFEAEIIRYNSIIKDYVQTQKPTLLYHKKFASWGFNYFYGYLIGFYIEYKNKIPFIRRAELIIPKKVYSYTSLR